MAKRWRIVLKEEVIKRLSDMDFDVIISNPPYQESDGGGTGDSAMPLYNLFIETSKKYGSDYMSIIIPSRWMRGGKGLSSFREYMVNDTHIRELHDYADAKECFKNLHIDGGVCCYLWDKSYNGEVHYKYKDLNGIVTNSYRFLKTEISDTVIRDINQISIIEKVKCKTSDFFNELVHSRNPFGFSADFFNAPEKYTNVHTYDESGDHSCRIYGVKGKKGGARRVSCYILESDIHRNRENINLYKLFFSKAYMTTSTVPPEIILGQPGTICTETFLLIGGFATQQEAQNCLSYIKTKFFRALLFFNRHSLNISKDSFLFIPKETFTVDSDIDWTKPISEIDTQLYTKYNLTNDEISFIESMIKPM